MFEKKTNQTDKYEVSKDTVVTVKNHKTKNERGEEYYKVEVTLRHKLAANDPVSFLDGDDISDFVNNIDLDNNQLSLIEK